MNYRRSFWKSLFDFSFNSFIAVQIIGAIYILAIVLISLFYFGLLITAFTQGGGYVLSGLIFVPLLWIINVTLTRIALEALVSSIKTSENTAQMLQIMQRRENI